MALLRAKVGPQVVGVDCAVGGRKAAAGCGLVHVCGILRGKRAGEKRLVAALQLDDDNAECGYLVDVGAFAEPGRVGLDGLEIVLVVWGRRDVNRGGAKFQCGSCTAFWGRKGSRRGLEQPENKRIFEKFNDGSRGEAVAGGVQQGRRNEFPRPELVSSSSDS